MTVTTWTRVCRVEVLVPGRGVAALVDGAPVAVFLLDDDEVAAIGNIDPFTGASVLSRGLVGSKGDVVTVASPVHKQRFDLRTGRCLDDDAVSIDVHAARIADGWVELAVS